MGFFSNLMGQKLLGTATIKFYGEDEASVEYETGVSDKDQKESDLMQLFALYYAKMLYNLNRGEHADNLIVYIEQAAEKAMSKDLVGSSIESRLHKEIENDVPEEWNKLLNASKKSADRANILSSEQKLIEPKANGITKKYSGELYEKSNQTRIVQTHMDTVGEGYYAPISTIMFFQYLINNLSESSLVFLSLIIRGMNQYYGKAGDYSNMRSIIEAPNYGFSVATQILQKSRE